MGTTTNEGYTVSKTAKVNDLNTVLDPDVLINAVDRLGRDMAKTREAIGAFIFGQEQVVEETLITLLAGGHLLLIGVPGLGKTRLVEVVAEVFGLDTKRVQFTPDLMPADILGSEILEESEGGKRSFRFLKGPVFCQLLMADEINRASPRTQSALLQAMQEHRVSVAGEYHALPKPFHVLATQNPLEQEGTYPLPEAQLDRFFMQVNVDYPDAAAEREILVNTTGLQSGKVERVMDSKSLIAAQNLVRQIPVGESVADGIVDLVRSARPDVSDIDDVKNHVSWGPGPRASQALMLGARARAMIEGRLSPSMDDVLALAHPILRHRMALTFAARAEGITLKSIIDKVCERIS